MSQHHKSYAQIIKSSTMIGGAQGINMLIGMVRVKFVALLIGPIGIGLVETYRAMVQVVGTMAGLGLQSSAVREVADAVASNDNERIGRTVLTLHRMCLLTGILGSLAVAIFAKKLSYITFNSPNHTFDVVLVGLTIIFVNLQRGQMALIQGMRRINDLAKLNVWGAMGGTIVSVGLYTWLGLGGVIPAIVSMSIVQFTASWWFAHKIPIPKVSMSWGDSLVTAGGMIKLGLAFMWSGLLLAGVAYATRVMITREFDLIAVGIFSAAYNLSGLVINFVLGAMGADYYPSLTAVSSDHGKMRLLVNQQTEVGLLLALPGLLATLALAPLVIKVFYSVDFQQASDLLRWFSLGCLGRVISWPMGFVVLAKGMPRLHAIIQTWANTLHIGLIWFFLGWMGIEGVSVAFFILYILHTFILLIVSRHLIDFSWDKRVLKLLGVIIPLVTGTFLVSTFLPIIPSTIIGLTACLIVGVTCLKKIILLLGPGHRLSLVVSRYIPIIFPEKKNDHSP